MKQSHIEQYLAGALSDADAAAFEEYCVANPEFARQVEFEQRLKAGIRHVGSGSSAEFVRSNHLARWKWAAAASILIAVASVFYVWQDHSRGAAQPVMAAVLTDVQRNGPTLRLALVRGAEATPSLAAGDVRIEIVGLFDPGYHYSVVLDRLEAKRKVDTVATLYGQHPTSPTTLEVMVDSDQLAPGSYSLSVRKQASDEEPLDFGFMKF